MLPTIDTDISNFFIGKPFIELLSVESTNSYAIDAIQTNIVESGTVFFAHQQTKGKGQRGKNWNADAGQNITLSCVINTKTLFIQHQFALSASVALACRRFLEKYIGDNTTIKWPNDIYWNDRKAAGILIENIVRGNDWQWAVIGIGININQTNFDDSLKNPVSLKQITGKHFSVLTLATELCQEIDIAYKKMLLNKAETVEAYNQYLYKKNQLVQLKKDSAKFTCIIDRVDDLGELQVKNGLQDSFVFGEVDWVL